MRRIQHKMLVLASVVGLAVASASCGDKSSVAGPSDVEAARGAKGKPTGGGTTSGSSLSWAMVTDKNRDGAPSFGDTVTFNVQTSATAYPWVTVTCKQNGTQVYQASRGIFATSLSEDFTLGPTGLWTSGAADCTATLENWDSYSKNGTITPLASISFAVN